MAACGGLFGGIPFCLKCIRSVMLNGIIMMSNYVSLEILQFLSQEHLVGECNCLYREIGGELSGNHLTRGAGDKSAQVTSVSRLYLRGIC